METITESSVTVEKPKEKVVPETREKHRGYMIEMNQKRYGDRMYKLYFCGVTVAGKVPDVDYSLEDPRTLLYLAESDHPDVVADNKAFFFKDKEDAEDLVELLNVYQDYDQELYGPFHEGCRMEFKIVEKEGYNKYTDLQKDFLDIENHMDFNLEQDKAKKWLDEYVAKEKANA
jgi:hypothetical protein